MRIKAEEALALVIDFQEKLVPVIHENQNLIHNTKLLLQGLNILQVPTLVTQQYTKGLGMTVEELTNLYGDHFHYEEKLTFSCADDENIIKKIKESGRRSIIVCGIETHICVLQTVIDLIALGYQVILVMDCVGSRKEADRLIGIKRALYEGAIPTTYEALLFELTRVAKTDTFKQISKLIK